MTKAMVFDLDGTLIDSLGDIAAATNRLLAEQGRAELTRAQVETLVGEGVNVLVIGAWDLTGPALPEAEVTTAIDRFLELYLDQAALRTIVFAGVPETLRALRVQGWKLGICTNKPDQITDRVLADLQLDQLVDVVVGGDFPRRKPDGEHILETLRRLDADPAKSVFVGDSKTDVAAARNAGIPVICVGFGYSHGPVEQLGADCILADYGDAGMLDLLAGRLLGSAP